MGIDLTRNFAHPYAARSFAEFWRRWHISLSSWFKDYVYVGLGGNRFGKTRTYVNLWITMLVSGLWHGAAWTFVVWGAWHAALLTIERLTSWPDRLERFGAPGRAVSTAVVFLLVVMSWVPFRAESLSQALVIWGHMLSLESLVEIPVFTGKELLLRTAVIFFLAIAMMISWWPFDLKRHRLAAPLFYGIIITAVVYFRGPGGAFIYFQF